MCLHSDRARRHAELSQSLQQEEKNCRLFMWANTGSSWIGQLHPVGEAGSSGLALPPCNLPPPREVEVGPVLQNHPPTFQFLDAGNLWIDLLELFFPTRSQRSHMRSLKDSQSLL